MAELSTRTVHQVTVEVVPWLNKYFGGKGLGRVTVVEPVPAGTTIRGLLVALGQKYPAFKAKAFEGDSDVLSDHIALLVNDSWLNSENFDLKLKDGDKITLLPAFAGG